MTYRVLLTGLLFVCPAASALAVDYSPALFSPAPISGYVDLRLGLGGDSESGTEPGNSWSESSTDFSFSGAGRVAMPLSSNLSLQADTWVTAISGKTNGTETCCGPYDDQWTDTLGGIGGHLTYTTPTGHLVGVLASLGAVSDWGMFGNIGVEAVHNYDNWRLYGQAGVSMGLTSFAADDAVKTVYAHGVVAYYFNPDFSVSGNLGIRGFSSNEDGGTNETTVTWGARLERKHPSMPVSGYIAYQGWHWSGSDNDPDTWSGTSHALMIGARLMLNQPTLRAMDQAVGLVDLNPIYGDLPH